MTSLPHVRVGDPKIDGISYSSNTWIPPGVKTGVRCSSKGGGGVCLLPKIAVDSSWLNG
jgi:hypothetical protein